MTFYWEVFPCKENKIRLGIIVSIILTFLFLVYLESHQFGWVALSAVIFILSLHKFFFKTSYELNNKEIIIYHMGKKSSRLLSDFKRIEFHKTGVFLSPFKKPSRLDSYRGVFVLYGKLDKMNINDNFLKFLPEDIKRVKSEK